MIFEFSLFTFLAMLCCHVISDFILQNDFLATYKQKKNWEEYIAKNKNYKYDYLVVLFTHAFIWSFITFFPIYLALDHINKGFIFGAIVFINMMVHAFVDDQKCNKLTINLLVDQICHMLQIILTFIACSFM